jgi:serine/threonine-protein kinase
VTTDETKEPTAAVPSYRLWAGRVIAGYRLEARLGRGGTAYALLATRIEDGAKVVFKVLLHKHRGSERREQRLLREAELMQSLDHPRVMPCLDSGLVDGYCYLVMPFVDALPLDVMLDEDGPLEPTEAIAMSEQLLDGLAYVHDHGMVHRDIKPANVLVKPDGDVYLTDFGLAITEQERMNALLTGEGWRPSRVGTRRFQAPEQRRTSRGIDGRADLYSFGVTLHQMLTVRFPIRHEGRRLARDEVPAALASVIERCLDPDPEARYADARELWKALQDCWV